MKRSVRVASMHILGDRADDSLAGSHYLISQELSVLTIK